MSIEDKRREAFEMSFQAPEGVVWSEELGRYAGGHYWWLQQDRWLAWNSALDGVVIELPRQSQVDDLMFISEARSIIEDAGLKVKP